MSICNECWGKGWIKKQGVQFDCIKCKGTGVIENEPQTNEEWLNGLATEEKAKAIYKIAKDDFKELRKLFYGVANDDCDAIALWLKQPHE